MGLQNLNIPADFLPIYNDYFNIIGTTFTSNLPANYKFVADVYLKDTKITRTKVFPDKTEQNGYFRLDRILQDYLSFDYLTTPLLTTVFADGSNCYSCYNSIFYEEYGDLSTGTTIFTATSITGDSRIIYNGSVSWKGDLVQNYDPSILAGLNSSRGQKTFIGYDPKRYIAEKISINQFGGYFLTNMPRNMYVDYDDLYFVGIFNINDYYTAELIVDTYDDNGLLISSYTISNAVTLLPNTATTVCSGLTNIIGVGPYNINSWGFSTYPAPIIDQNVKYYEVYTQFNDTINLTERTSEKLRFTMRNKKYYQKFRFAWLNKNGQFDRFSFEGRNYETISANNKTEFKKLFGKENNGSYVYENNSRGRQTIYQNVSTSFVANSQWLTKDESYWLNELFTSPEVYLEVPQTFKRYITSANESGQLRLIFNEPHNFIEGDDIGIIDCDDITNNQYVANITVTDPYSIIVPIAYFSTNNGIVFVITKQVKALPIMIDSTDYLVKDGFTPKNIQVQINFTLSLEDPRQRGGNYQSSI